jgi:prephenate dehydrogenase
MRIIISGLGLMGGSLALAIRRHLPDVELLGHDRPEVTEQACERKMIHAAVSDWPGDCARADLVFLATPVTVIRDQIRELHTVVSKSTVVSDLGSTKEELNELVNQIGFSGTFVGGHPLAGAEKKGITAATPLLYENAVYVLTPAGGIESELPAVLVEVLEAIKARILAIPASEHDRIVAYISHLPQLVSVALMNLVGGYSDKNSHFLRLAAGGFRDLTRIASSPFDIWNDILKTNRSNIEQALNDFIVLLENVRDRGADLAGEFDSANAYRRQLPKDRKGFINPLVDVLVMVSDQVGVVAKISTALFDKNIDIRDIELLKLREGEGGIFRLSFQGVTDAQNAVILLNKLGYQAQIRE